MNKNTTNTEKCLNILSSIENIAKTLKLSKTTYIHAILLSEIFTCLITQFWYNNKKKSIHFPEKTFEIIAMSANFILKSGLLYDPVYIITIGKLNTIKIQCPN